MRLSLISSALLLIGGDAIAGAPHNVYYEAAEPYNAIVDAFLATVLAPVGAR